MNYQREICRLRAILDEIAEVLHPHWPKNSRNSYMPHQLKFMIESMINKNDWINVSDALPEHNDECWIYVPEIGTIHGVYVHEKGHPEWHSHDEGYVKPTHWMKLTYPMPPDKI